MKAALIDTLAERFGTPLYVYDLDDLERRRAELCAVLPAGARILYSMKANPLPSLVGALAAGGCGADVSSHGELRAACDAGVDPGTMLFTGPGKTVAEVDEALDAGVVWFSCESPREIDVVRERSERRRAAVRCLVRINPGATAQGGLSMAGDGHFGMSVETAIDLARGGGVEGMHVYFGTQMAGVDALMAAFETALAAAERVADEASFAPRILNLGGGFPWPYAVDAPPPDLAALRERLAALLASRRATARADTWFESGRFLVASSGTLVARVLDVRPQGDGRRAVVLDAGINHLGGASGLGRIMRPDMALRPVHERPGAPAIDARVVGPLCTPLDCLVRKASMPEVAPGDLVRVPNVGAYGVTASLVAFLSRRPPVEVSVRGDAVVAVHRLAAGHVSAGVHSMEDAVR